jgi:hypothetical protein
VRRAAGGAVTDTSGVAHDSFHMPGTGRSPRTPQIEANPNGAARRTFARVEPTNNAAERAVRKADLWRKTSFRSASRCGSRFVARMLTVCESLRAQGRSILGFLVAYIGPTPLGGPQPSYLPMSLTPYFDLAATHRPGQEQAPVERVGEHDPAGDPAVHDVEPGARDVQARAAGHAGAPEGCPFPAAKGPWGSPTPGRTGKTCRRSSLTPYWEQAHVERVGKHDPAGDPAVHHVEPGTRGVQARAAGHAGAPEGCPFPAARGPWGSPTRAGQAKPVDGRV